jgi:hypothetical protein
MMNYHVAIGPLCAKVCFRSGETLNLACAVDGPGRSVVPNSLETALNRLTGKEAFSEKPELHNAVYFENGDLHIKLATAKHHISDESVAALKLQHVIGVECPEAAETPHADFALATPSI